MDRMHLAPIFMDFDGFLARILEFIPARSLTQHAHAYDAMDSTTSTSISTEFEIIHKSIANGIHPVTKYKSKSTGLLLYHAEVRGPTVSGYIVLGTFPAEDDGLPHCLEHLIFLGSEKYPHKGILDILAGKCMSNGTNAYTDPDHTCYTLETAGQTGFCCLLPIYLDHVFFPTLEAAGFAAEVHNYTRATGEHQGVVYSEQQAKEGDIEVLSQYELCRVLYPPTSGYHFVSGGTLRNLRNSCNINKVRICHNKFYSTKNAVVIVCGVVDHDKLFGCIEPFLEEYRQKKGEPPEVVKSWNNEVPYLPESVTRTIRCPAQDSEDAYVTIGFRGPSVVRKFEESVAMKILLAYLSDTSVSPLQTEFVERDDPICSEVGCGELENSEMALFFEFEEVPIEAAADLPARVRALLERQVHRFDMERITTCIENQISEELSAMENNPHNSIAYSCIADFLYGDGSNQMFDRRLNTRGLCTELLEYTKKDWVRLIQENILNQQWATIIAIPEGSAPAESVESVSKIGKTKSKGNRQHGQTQEKHTQPQEDVPAAVMAAIKVPRHSSIDWHEINRVVNPDFAKDFDCNVVFDFINSNFVYITFHMDTTKLKPEHRKYLGLYMHSFTESEMIGDDGVEVIDYEDVVIGLEENLMNLLLSLGINHVTPFTCGDFNHIMSVSAQFEIEKIGLGFQWLRRLLLQINWTADRLKIMISKLISEINQTRRKGQRIARAIVHNSIFKEESNGSSLVMVRQQTFLRGLRAGLPQNESQIAKTLQEMRSILMDPTNVTIQIATSGSKLNAAMKKKKLDLRSLLRSMFPFRRPHIHGSHEKKFVNTPDRFWMRDLKSTTPRGYIVGTTSEECGYLYQVCDCISDFNDPDYPALCTAIQYFLQVEGPFFRAIRGGGYAYDFFMFSNPPKGVLVYQLSHCASTIGAYRASKDTIHAHVMNPNLWNFDLLVSAKSSYTSEVVERQATPLGLATHALACAYRNVPLDFSSRLIERVQAATLADVQRATKLYLEPMFAKPTNCAVVVPRERVERVAEDFKRIGKILTVLHPVLEDGILGQWKF